MKATEGYQLFFANREARDIFHESLIDLGTRRASIVTETA